MIECKICGAEVRRIVTSGHLRKHGITTEQYVEKFPGAPITSNETRQALTDMHARPDVKAKHRDALLAHFAVQENKEYHRNASIAAWGNADGRRAAVSKKTSARMQDKALVARMSAASRTPEARAKKSLSLQGKNAGERSAHWEGGISPERYWERGGYKFAHGIAPKIRERDGFRCVDCGRHDTDCQTIYGCALHVHHIDHDGQNNDPANLVTLCKGCHISRHNRER